MTDAARPPSGYLLDRRRFMVLALAGTAGTAVLGACSGSSVSGRAGGGRPTLRLSHGALGFPSPFASNGGPGYNQMTLLYDTLLWKDGSGTLLPWLARSHEVSDDHLTHRFSLREGVTWSDGRPLTADDVVFTFEYYAAQGSLSPPVLVQPPEGIAGVSAPDAGTVEIVLAQPLVTFAEQVAGALPVIPRHVWSSIDDPGAAIGTEVLVGTGPYRLASYGDDGGPLLYEAREDYFLGHPYVGRIEMNALEDPFAALLSGTADAATGLGLRDDILAPFQRGDEFGIVTQDGAWTHALYFNLGRETAVSDPAFRRACALAIDRNDLVSRLAAGKGLPGNPGFLSPENPFFVPVPQYEHDVAAANSLLDGAGYGPGPDGVRRHPDGSPLRFELRFDNAEVALSEVIVAALRAVGVQLDPRPVQIGPELFGNKLFGGYDMVVLPFPGPAPGGPNADPDVLRVVFSSKVPPSLTGATSYVNREFDEAADRQRTTFDEEERRRLVARMQEIVAADVPVLPLYYPRSFLAFRRRVLDEWYFTPGQYPTADDNKQLFVTGSRAGSDIRPVA
ncbi:MAG: ABC transporter substrate-binding protein [Acidimicrobiales bacterium]